MKQDFFFQYEQQSLYSDCAVAQADLSQVFTGRTCKKERVSTLRLLWGVSYYEFNRCYLYLCVQIIITCFIGGLARSN